MNDLSVIADRDGLKNKVTIATFNINGLMPSFQPSPGVKQLAPYPLRHEEICKWFENSDVDIINFQEVFSYRNLNLLRKHLPSYPHVKYAPFLFGPRGALVIFSKMPLRARRYRSFLTPALKSNRSNLPKGSLMRSALKGVLMARAVDAPLTIVNTHLLYNAEFNWEAGSNYFEIEKAQLDKVIQAVKKQGRRRPNNTVLLGGDMNVEVGSFLAKYFLESVGLDDIFDGDEASTFHNVYVTPPGFGKRIDFLLTSNAAKVADRRRLFVKKVMLNGRNEYLSDHIGLEATINLDHK